MPYKIDQQLENDFDIFLFDREKIIHIATAGGVLPNKLSNIEIDFRVEALKVNLYRRVFDIKTNENIDKKGITDNKIYLSSFNWFAKRGFYSYDKSNIDDPLDTKYQLVSYPIYDREIELEQFAHIIYPTQKQKYTLGLNVILIETSKQFPKGFDVFDILEYL